MKFPALSTVDDVFLYVRDVLAALSFYEEAFPLNRKSLARRRRRCPWCGIPTGISSGFALRPTDHLTLSSEELVEHDRALGGCVEAGTPPHREVQKLRAVAFDFLRKAFVFSTEKNGSAASR